MRSRAAAATQFSQTRSVKIICATACGRACPIHWAASAAGSIGGGPRHPGEPAAAARRTCKQAALSHHLGDTTAQVWPTIHSKLPVRRTNCTDANRGGRVTTKFGRGHPILGRSARNGPLILPSIGRTTVTVPAGPKMQQGFFANGPRSMCSTCNRSQPKRKTSMCKPLHGHCSPSTGSSRRASDSGEERVSQRDLAMLQHASRSGMSATTWWALRPLKRATHPLHRALRSASPGQSHGRFAGDRLL